MKQAYTSPRPDICALLPPAVTRVLDVGCSNGTLGAGIKHQIPAATVHGIECCEQMAEAAAGRMDVVHQGDALEVLQAGALPRGVFDVVILADVLEHLADPWAVLRAIRPLLSARGVILASIPNVRHISTLYRLAILGDWPDRERGIHDRTHLRFFTRRSIRRLFVECGYHIEEMGAHYRWFERPLSVNRWARLWAWLPGGDFWAFQYLLRARLGPPPESGPQSSGSVRDPSAS